MDFKAESSRLYTLDDEGKLIAEITFPETAPGIYTIDHTFVDDALRGQGVAGQLVAAAVKQIKVNGGKVTATCSYAQNWLKKHLDEIDK